MVKTLPSANDAEHLVDALAQGSHRNTNYEPDADGHPADLIFGRNCYAGPDGGTDDGSRETRQAASDEVLFVAEELHCALRLLLGHRELGFRCFVVRRLRWFLMCWQIVGRQVVFASHIMILVSIFQICGGVVRAAVVPAEPVPCKQWPAPGRYIRSCRSTTGSSPSVR